MRRLQWLVLIAGLVLPMALPARTARADTIYLVQSGDNLSRIAAKFGVSPAAISAANGIANANVIVVGQRLVIPGVGGGSAAASGGGAYTVQPGDNLSRIAAKLGVSYSALLSANQITNPNLIGVGQTLIIPSASLRASPGGGVVAAPVSIPVPLTSPRPVAGAGINHMGTEKVVITDYMMWYGSGTFDGRQTWDVPRDGAYNSDDYGTIQRHVSQAQQACLNGFAAHWYGPQEGRTTHNFNQLLSASAGTGLRHAVVIQTNILPSASETMIIDAIKHVLDNWAQNPNYLRLGGKPAILFTDMPRPWGSDAALEGWARIRAAADPNHSAIWMAEGLSPTYNPLFDGLYVYRIDHRDYPQSWLKQARWANGLRAVERRGDLPIGGLYFADTIAPGFDDTRAAAAGSDLRSPAPSFARDRRDGGDFLLVKSFNEWIEGTQIEPGSTYGDWYLNLTCHDLAYAKSREHLPQPLSLRLAYDRGTKAQRKNVSSRLCVFVVKFRHG
ncbi:MAG: LysM peptidoglycan-binding domain-containing protein [Anaerolineales bacterium]